MGRKPPTCKLCKTRPAAVPDRNSGTSTFRREVCRECHAERLRADFAHVLKVSRKAPDAQ